MLSLNINLCKPKNMDNDLAVRQRRLRTHTQPSELYSKQIYHLYFCKCTRSQQMQQRAFLVCVCVCIYARGANTKIYAGHRNVSGWRIVILCILQGKKYTAAYRRSV